MQVLKQKKLVKSNVDMTYKKKIHTHVKSNDVGRVEMLVIPTHAYAHALCIDSKYVIAINYAIQY